MRVSINGDPSALVTRAMAALAGTVGAVEWLGWLWRSGASIVQLPGVSRMPPGSALGFLFGGLGLWTFHPSGLNSARRTASCALGLMTGLVGALVVFETTLGWPLHLNEIAIGWRPTSEPGGTIPASSLLDSVGFLCLGAHLVIANTKPRATRGVLDLLSLIPVFISLLALVGYACQVPTFYGSTIAAPSTVMALRTAVVMAGLGIGHLWMRGNDGLAALLMSNTGGGMVARRLLLAPVVIPLVTGLATGLARRHGFFNPELAGWLLSFSNIFVFTVVLWWISARLDGAEKTRLAAEREVHTINSELELRVQRRTAELFEAKESLKRSEAFLARSQKLAHLGSWELDRVSGLDLKRATLRWSDETYRILGFLPGEVTPTNDLFFSRVHPEDRTRVRESLARALQEGQFYSCEHRICLGDGAIRTVLELGEIEHSVTGADMMRVLGTIQDTTEIQRAAESVAGERILQRLLIDNLPVCVFVKDLEGRFLLYNRESVRMAGLASEAEALGKTVFDFFPGELAERYSRDDRSVIESGLPVKDREERFVDPDGHLRWLVTTKLVLRDSKGAGIGILGISRDVTEAKQMGEALRNSERRFRALIEKSGDSISVVDAENRLQYLSPAVARIEGYTPEECVGRSAFERVHPEDLGAVKDSFATVLASPGGSVPVQWRGLHKSGSWIWLEGLATNLLADPAVGGVVTNYRDITERKSAEQKVLAQLARLALLHGITRAVAERQDLVSIFQVVLQSLESDFPTDFGCVCILDEATRELVVRCVSARGDLHAAPQALGIDSRIPIDTNGLSRCARGELVFDPELHSVPFEFAQSMAKAGLGSLVAAPLAVEGRVLGVLLVARTQTHGFSSGECEFLRQLSGHVSLAVHQNHLYGAMQKAYEGLRQTQQAMMQQERLRALGQMASGIAHDINNAISPLALYTEKLLDSEPALTREGRENLEIIKRAVFDVAATVERLREFYRQPEAQLKFVPVQLNRMVHQVAELTRARWEDMPQQRGIVIRLLTELPENLPDVHGVEAEIREALINLVFNAVDAMPDGGTLTIRTRPFASSDDAQDSGRVHLEVQDTGNGMDEETRRRCYEPFFTTKGERGTGLGLAMVYGMAQRHGADIEIDTALGRGTCVRLRFPVPPSAVVPAPPPSVRPTRALRPLKILLVDDDPLVAKAVRMALQIDNHIVEIAGGGQAGIDAFGAAREPDQRPFDVIITDLGMPHVDGRQVAAAVKQAAPSTPVILLTGWGQRFADEDGSPSHIDVVLSKPTVLRELRDALNACFPAQTLGCGV